MNAFGFAYSMRIYRYVRILRKHKIENTLPAEKTCARSIPSRQSFKNKAKRAFGIFQRRIYEGLLFNYGSILRESSVDRSCMIGVDSI
jgi:hypothetical protein